MEYCLSMFKQHSSVVKHGLPIPELAMKVSFSGNDCWTKFGNLPARHVWLPEGTEDFFFPWWLLGTSLLLTRHMDTFKEFSKHIGDKVVTPNDS